MTSVLYWYLGHSEGTSTTCIPYLHLVSRCLQDRLVSVCVCVCVHEKRAFWFSLSSVDGTKRANILFVIILLCIFYQLFIKLK